MKITTSWRGNKKARKSVRTRQKPKIRWEHLGLTDPADESATPSIEEIRRQVVSLSARGLGQAARLRLSDQSSPTEGIRRSGKAGSLARRGATE
jgi:hypothetical protein